MFLRVALVQRQRIDQKYLELSVSLCKYARLPENNLTGITLGTKVKHILVFGWFKIFTG